MTNSKRPNIVFVFSDQHRAQAVGYNGNKDVKTPNLDKLKENSICFNNAISGNPVCSPYRASLLTGQYALTHGVFVNDVQLDPDATSIAKVLKKEGYDTAYIGKWHINDNGRKNFIPEENRQGFDYWKVLECTHDYNNSIYYGDTPQKKKWDGYDAIAQTRDAQQYIKNKKEDSPFVLFLSWGPPHAPYRTAPEKYQKMYDPKNIELRPNIPESGVKNPAQNEVELNEIKKDLAGYYAHISALDDCIGDLQNTMEEEGIAENTIFIYTSDHGDLIGSHGAYKKQRPWEECIRVPFLLRYPQEFNDKEIEKDKPINSVDIMPTLLGLCNVEIPETVEGSNYTPYLKDEGTVEKDGVIVECIYPFGQWYKEIGGKEYRGLRTERFTYVRALEGPWLLFDNQEDPYQLNNLIGKEKYSDIQDELDQKLMQRLKDRNDDFLPGEKYIEKWGYETDERGTVPY